MEHQKWMVVITDCDHVSIEEEKKVFAQIKADLVWAKLEKEEEIIRECRDADGLLNQYALMTRRVLENLPRV